MCICMRHACIWLHDTCVQHKFVLPVLLAIHFSQLAMALETQCNIPVSHATCLYGILFSYYTMPVLLVRYEQQWSVTEPQGVIQYKNLWILLTLGDKEDSVV